MHLTTPLMVGIGLFLGLAALSDAEEGRTLRSLFVKKSAVANNAPVETEAAVRKAVRQELDALDGRDRKLPAAVALERLLKRLDRLPDGAAPLDPGQEAIAKVLRAKPVRGRLINQSIELLMWDCTRQFGGRRKDQVFPALRIFRALGVPKDVPGWQINLRMAMDRLADDGVETQIEVAERASRAIWAVGERAGDQWPNMSKEINSFTFVWAFHHHESFRPANWPKRMRSALDTDQPAYLRVYAFNHTPLPLHLTGSLDDENIDNLAWLIRFGMRTERNSSRFLLPVQIAAVKLAGRSRSVYFVPEIKSVLDQEIDPELRRAADTALKACTRPAAHVTPSPETDAQLAMDTKRIDAIFATWDATPDGLPQVEELRTLIGLDYGDDRAAWLKWWERDKQSRKMCRHGERQFLYRGRVRDDRGRPLAGTTVSVSVAGEFTYHKYGGPIVGWVDTDRDGRFLIRCGFRTIDRDHRGIVSAVLNINKPGYHFLASTGPLKRYFTEFDLRGEPLIQIAPDEIVHPRSAVDLDVILRPAVEVEVTVVDAAGDPVQPLNIEARWTELHPEEASPVAYCGCCGETWAGEIFTPETAERNQTRSVYLAAEQPGLPPSEVRATMGPYQKLRTDPNVSFYFSQFRPGVSRRFALFTTPKAKEPDAVSNLVTFPAAGRYRVRLTWNPTLSQEERLHAEVLPAR